MASVHDHRWTEPDAPRWEGMPDYGRLPDAFASEDWQPIEGFAGLYEVSSQGQVRSIDRIGPHGRKIPGRARKPSVDRYGYACLILYKDGSQHHRKIHRLVCAAFCGAEPAGCEVGHIDGNKLNNSAANLRWVTRMENMRQRFGAGLRRRDSRPPKPVALSLHLPTPANPYRCHPKIGGPGQPRGERHGSAKLMPDQVSAIRQGAEAGRTQRALACQFGISRRQVRDIISGKKWAHIFLEQSRSSHGAEDWDA